MVKSKAETFVSIAMLGVIGLLIYLGFIKLARVSILTVILFIIGAIGSIAVIVGLSWYVDRTKTEPRERTVRRPDRRYNTGYREEQETYQAIIPLSYEEIEQTKRTGKRIMIVGALCTLCLIALWVPSSASQTDASIRYISTESGMNFRVIPSATGKLIRVIPFKAAVNLLELGPEETIYGKTARWMKVEYYGQTGWIWGYFTSTEKPQ